MPWNGADIGCFESVKGVISLNSRRLGVGRGKKSKVGFRILPHVKKDWKSDFKQTQGSWGRKGPSGGALVFRLRAGAEGNSEWERSSLCLKGEVCTRGSVKRRQWELRATHYTKSFDPSRRGGKKRKHKEGIGKNKTPRRSGIRRGE